MLRLTALTLIFLSVSNAFYLPGLAPVTYCKAGSKDSKPDCKVGVLKINK